MTDEKSVLVQPKDDIEFHKGFTNILLIAPHGVESDPLEDLPLDDIGTAELTRQIQKHLGCSAVINTAFRKPTGKDLTKRNHGVPDLKEKVLNLNLVEQASQVEEFTSKIKEVVNADGLTYVFWIHGIADVNIRKFGNDVKCLLGYGQPNTEASPEEQPRPTAEQKTIDIVLREFEQKGIKTIPAPETSKYRGWKKTYMNQWFLKKYNFDQVQSIQLEFKKTGCRRKEDLETMAERIANAISALVPPVEKITEPADKAPVPEKITDPKEVKNAIDVGEPESIPSKMEVPEPKLPADADAGVKVDTKPEPTVDGEVSPGPIEEIPTQETAQIQKMTDKDDRENVIDVGETVYDPLVEIAYSNLVSIFSKHYEKAMMEAGRYIIKTFYGNDIFNAKANKPTHEKTLNQLYEKIEENRNPNSPSKSKLYHAKNLIVQEYDLKKYLSKESFSTFRNLSLSHKIYLLSVRNIFRKKGLIEQVALKKLSVRELQDEMKGSQTNDPKPLQLINNPKKIWEDENSKFINYDSLINHSYKELIKYQDTLTLKKETYEKYLKKFKDIEKELEKAIETNKGKPEKLFGFQEWIKHSVNISKGCSNDCKYCFAKSAGYRRKQVENGQWHEGTIREQDLKKKHKLYDGLVGFPTSHDITPSNVEEYIKVLKKLLNFGNEILIVSKPNLDCIKKICEIEPKHNEKILFRFSIGAMDDDILSFWDTNAPKYEERKNSLKYAFENGFQTSVSMEPLLDSANVVRTVSDLVNFVSDSIWIGKMNYTEELWDEALKNDDENLLKKLEAIESGQTDDKIKSVYAEFQEHPDLLKKIKWKDSYREVLEKEIATEAGTDT